MCRPSIVADLVTPIHGRTLSGFTGIKNGQPTARCESSLWVARKDTRTVRAIVRVYPYGREFVILLCGDSLMARFYGDGEDSRTLGEMSAGARDLFVARGWTLDVEAERSRA